MTKDNILCCKLPGDMFSSPSEMDKEYIELAKKWHPDKPGGSIEVMTAINALRETGLIMIKLGQWDAHHSRHIELIDGKEMKINFLKENDFLLGKEYICASACVYVFDSFVPKIPSFLFPSKTREEELLRYIPKVLASYTSKAGSHVLAIDKRPHMFCLRDVMKFYGTVPPRHVAWIISSLYNLCCFLKYNKMVHNAINLDTYFISPSKHIGNLTGGWWYHTYEGDVMERVPADTYSVMSSSTKESKRSSYGTDLECVKLIGRSLLGSPGGSELYRNEDVPKKMIQFLRTVSSDNAVEEYKLWGDMLRECYGARKFIDMEIDLKKIYPSD